MQNPKIKLPLSLDNFPFPAMRVGISSGMVQYVHFSPSYQGAEFDDFHATELTKQLVFQFYIYKGV
jgi:hypothetical protein